MASVSASASLQGETSSPRKSPSSAAYHHQTSPFLVDALGLAQPQKASAFPAAEHVEILSGSDATFSQYQASAIGDLHDDPFFGATSSNIDSATSSFMDMGTWDQSVLLCKSPSISDSRNEFNSSLYYPPTPTHTASIHAVSPQKVFCTAGLALEAVPNSVSPLQLQKPFTSKPQPASSTQLTPPQSSSTRTSEDGVAPTIDATRLPSPRVTVSVWDQDHSAPGCTVERTLQDCQRAANGGVGSPPDFMSASGQDDTSDCWPQTGQDRSGLSPENRPVDQVLSINEMASKREKDERMREVDRWRSAHLSSVPAPPEKTDEEMRAIESKIDRDDGVPLGHQTENRHMPGQTIIEGPGGEISDLDREIFLSSRNWADPPVLRGIQDDGPERFQPHSSAGAMAKFERMCRDNDSTVSRSATWGTRRRSLPSVVDVEGVTSGSFLKKLSISRGHSEKVSRPGSFLRDLRGLVRGSGVNQLRKRSRSRSNSRSVCEQDDATRREEPGVRTERESTLHLSPETGSSLGGKKTASSINNTLASVGQNFVSMWTSHSRSVSVSGTSPVASPRASSGNLSVKNSLRRPRSKSEAPKAGTDEDGTPSLVEIWRRSGGPPVTTVFRLGRDQAADEDADDDEDDDLDEEGDSRVTNSEVIDDFTPNFPGFQQYVTKLNPELAEKHAYLVDRIAHQLDTRYKELRNARVKHLGPGANDFARGPLGMTRKEAANTLIQQSGSTVQGAMAGPSRGDEGVSSEGAINQETFPRDIPMPPTRFLPAEFECQLCFQKKKFQKPSDWTKHVHEDVQPFTCTWDNCKDTKVFKRKADWVRHENEGHRHLEWWACDVDDCTHKCYRRNNFLQHLYREHKFTEPNDALKAATKRVGSMDPTNIKVEQCHFETEKRPQDEPCRFCGKAFPTWKKLTVHLAKHMEQISLPIVRLVAAKQADADSITCWSKDVGQRQELSLSGNPSSSFAQLPGHEHHMRSPTAPQQLSSSHGHQQGIALLPSNQSVYPHGSFGDFQQQSMLEGFSQSLPQPGVDVGSLDQTYAPSQQSQEAFSIQLDNLMRLDAGASSMPDDGTEPFPQLSASSLELQDFGEAQMSGELGEYFGYDSTMNPCSVSSSPFHGNESLSTYSHSPHLVSSSNICQDVQQPQPQPQPPWTDRRLYM